MKVATDTITAISQGFVPMAAGSPVPDANGVFVSTLIYRTNATPKVK
jgi:hypothetical protein